jgi:dGTPase
MENAQRIVRELIGCYMSDNGALPRAWGEDAARLDDRRRARLVADFVAGMTDRFAMAEHKRLSG